MNNSGVQAMRLQKSQEEREIPVLFLIGSVLAMTVLLLPVFIVVLAGLNSGDYLSFPPEGLSFRWIMEFLTSGTYLDAFLFSFQLAVLTTVVSTVVGTMAALYISRSGNAISRFLRNLFLAPIVLPGVVLGLSLYVFYATTEIGLVRSFTGLLIGHVIVTFPFVVATVTASLAGFDMSLEEAARSLGAGPLTAFTKITLKIIAPGVMAGSIFAFIVSFGQFEVSLFLSAADLEPLPIAMYVSLRYKFEPIAAAAGIFAIFLVVISMVLTSRLVNFKRLLGHSDD